jgi:hypothetical protein
MRKSLDKKAVSRFIAEARADGKANQEIYNELSPQYYDKKGIALLITGTPTREDKEKYKIHNAILLALLGATILFKVLFVLQMAIPTKQWAALLFIFVVPIFNIWFFIEIARYSAGAYRFTGIFTLLGLMQSLQNQTLNVSKADMLVNILFTAAIAGLAFYLDAKLFPNYRPTNMRKDANGEYILS